MSDRTRLSRCTVVVAGLAGLLAGCTGGATETPRVATLQSAAAVTPSGSTDQRPVFAIDATSADKQAMTRPWAACMVKNGGPQFKYSADELIEKGGVPADDAKSRAVLLACLPLQPEALDEHQKRTDPAAFKDNQREWYQCAKAAGYQLTEPDPDTGQFGLSTIGPNGDFGSPKMQSCHRTAFTD